MAYLNAIRWIGASTLTALIGKLLTFLSFILLARNLSVDDFARFGLMYSYLTAAAVFVSAGIYEAVVSQYQRVETEDKSSQLFSHGLGYFCAFASIIMLMVGVVVVATGKTLAEWVEICVALAIGLMSGFVGLHSSFMRLSGGLNKSLKVTAVFSIVSALGLLGSSWCIRSVASVLAGYGLASIVALLCIRKYGDCRVTIPGVVRSRYLFRESVPYILIAAIGWMSGHGINNVNSLLLGAGEIATYTFLITASSAMLVVGNSINMYWGPRIINAYRNGVLCSKMHSDSHAYYLAVLIAMSVVVWIILAIYESALVMIGGNVVNYRGKSLELALVLSSLIISVPWWNAQHYFHANGAGPLLMKVNILVGLPALAIWILLIYVYGEIGVYVGLLISAAVRSLALCHIAAHKWGCMSPGMCSAALVVFTIYIGIKNGT